MYVGRRYVCVCVSSVGRLSHILSILFVLRYVLEKVAKKFSHPYFDSHRTHVQIERVELVLLHEVLELSLQPRSTIPVGHV